MKRLICLMLAIIIIGCQQESIELSKIELDKASLKRVLEANADYQRLPKAFDNFKLEAIDQLSKMTQEELNNLSSIFSKYSGTEILNASDAVKTLVKKYMPEDEYILLQQKITVDLKKYYIFKQIDLNQFFLERMSVTNAKDGGSGVDITCKEIADHIFMTVFSDCMIYNEVALFTVVSNQHQQRILTPTLLV